jgi:hypothetical protein
MQVVGELNSPLASLPAKILSKSSFCPTALTKLQAAAHN